MTRRSQDCSNLEAIADLVAHCRDSARALRLDMLTYCLDVAFVAARADIDHTDCRPDMASFRRMFVSFDGWDDNGEPRLLELSKIRTTIQECRNWAQELNRATLVYVLETALSAARKASTDQD